MGSSLTRTRKGLPINGWLVIDKPLGMTSAQVVGKVRWLTKAQKVGHAGTLDPAATGVLPIALGEATKTVAYAMDVPKTYRFTVQWGTATDTDDAEGKPIRTSDARPTADQIAAILPGFTGAISQMPPIYSALKIDGERAYDLARAGEDVILKARQVQVHSLVLTATPDPDHAVFEASVGKGTYVRSLARDMAETLGTAGHVVQLRRVNVGKFTESMAISLEKLAEVTHGAALDAYLAPVGTALDDIPALALTDAEAQSLRQGQSLSFFSRTDADRLGVLGETRQGMALALIGDTPVALVEVLNAEIRSVRVFNL
jgi:tRNA pseudouridine55 synthase